MKDRKAHLGFIFATIFIDCLGIGILIPILPDVIRRFSGDPTFVGQYFGYFISIYAFMQFIASPILGSLSDRFGRRPVLLVSLVFGALDYVLMAYAPSLSILFIGRIISGLTGASITVATAYIADISPDEKRAANFGLIGAAFGLGFIVGPAVGGLIGTIGPTYPFLAAALLNFLNFLFGIFVLPESLPKESRRHIEVKKLNPFSSMMKVWGLPEIRILISIFFLLYLAGAVNPSIWTLYTEYRFNWTPAEVGWSLATVGLMIAFVQGYLTGKVISKIEKRTAIIAAIFINSISFIAYALVTHGWQMYLILIPGALGWISGPILQDLISKKVPANEQGELQGTMMSVSSLTAILGPLVYTYLFVTFTKEGTGILFPGAPFLAAGILCLLALGLFVSQKKISSVSQEPK